MTLPVRALGAALVTALAAALLSLVATAPSSLAAEPRAYGTISRVNDSLLRACKEPASATAWRVLVRVDNRQSADEAIGRMWVLRNGVRTDRRWSSGWVPARRLGAPGAVIVPRSSGWTLEATISQRNAGSGGQFALSRIRAC